jgi:hypothetical protein
MNPCDPDPDDPGPDLVDLLARSVALAKGERHLNAVGAPVLPQVPVTFDMHLYDQIDVVGHPDEVVLSVGPVQISFDDPQAIEALCDALAEASVNLKRGQARIRQKRQAAEWRGLCQRFGPAWEAQVRDEAGKGLLSDTFIRQVGQPSTWPEKE